VPRKLSEPDRRAQEAFRERLQWILDHLFKRNQRALARALGISQSLLSRVLRGLQGGGPHLIAAVAGLPGLNPEWVHDGTGEALAPEQQADDSAPVTNRVLPGAPQDHANQLTGERHPLAPAFFRPTRYFCRLPREATLLTDTDGPGRSLALLAGDLLLLDANPALWTGNLFGCLGGVFGVRIDRLGGWSYEIGMLTRNEKGLCLNLFPEVVQLRLPRPERDETTPATSGRGKRRVLNLSAGVRAKLRGEEQETSPASPKPLQCELDDLVAIRVYTVRPA
jgi:transcriptional regulator with XRE-family HTH domain